tara:strand:- start:3530 stop:3733 length:204 start_codon:yes stop_codon:yes gene_type:complete
MMVNPERFISMTSLCCLEAEVPSWLGEDSCFEVSCSDCDLHAIFNMFQANDRVYIVTEPTCYEEEEE